MSIIGTLLSSILVSLLWGTTNVIIKNSTKEINKNKGGSRLQTFINDVKYLALNWKHLLPFFVNQIGSFLFYITLLYSELSLIVPLTNSLTFLCTAATSIYFGEEVPSAKTFFGSLLVLTGISCCVIDKIAGQ